jgi:hypothetical protein
MTRAIATLLFSACLVSASAREETPMPVETIRSVLQSYATAFGCVVRLEDENILPHDVDGDEKKEFIVLFGIDLGCSEGIAMHQPVLAILERGTQDQVFVRPQHSFPAAPLEGFIQNIDRIFIENGQLWYEGKDFDWANDARCCPSVPVKARIFLRDGVWKNSREP